MTGYYDALLVLIPVALVGVSAVLAAIGAANTTAVTLGGVVAAGLVAHGLFVNEPSDTGTHSSSSSYEPAD
ncbi:hypothetical protein HALDL1_10570 [Halobacterium sp. DL1]|jgi:hypothetical protein|nr:hypothetical protein HALDL1_10570 [Halobacterium sp. DL1]